MTTLHIYKVTWPDWGGWDVYDSFICIAESEQAARDAHPGGPDYEPRDNDRLWVAWERRGTLEVERIGTADPGQEPGVILASFNAG